MNCGWSTMVQATRQAVENVNNSPVEQTEVAAVRCDGHLQIRGDGRLVSEIAREANELDASIVADVVRSHSSVPFRDR